MARARRELLLRVHRHRLRREDLEDCYSQATLELLADARRGARHASQRALETAIERRFISRIRDRRRALSGRSPIQAAIESSVSLAASGQEDLELVDARAELETLVILRLELRRVQTLIRELSPDQRLVLISQVALQMAYPRGAPEMGPLVDPPPAGAVGWRAMPVRKVDYLLIGGGLASGNCARWLREEGADGEILLVGREPDPPYNRPECSKGYLRGEESREETYFRPNDFWEEQRIELLTRSSVMDLDVRSRTATLSSKEEISFEQALIATGANVRRLNVDGCHLEQIHYLRTLGNADAIRAGAEDANEVVLIGGSFIGCEVAASLTALGKSCAIVMPEQAPLEVTFGARVGGFIQERLESVGVRFHSGEELARFEGDSRVEKVVTKSGLELPGDMTVVGVGVIPDVQLAQKAGLEIGERGGVRCSAGLESSTPGVYAAGDICEYESVIHGGAHLRIEHWDVAFNHGKTAALNMLGRNVAHEEVPYFYSVLAGLGELEYVGPAYEWDDEILRGSFEEASFTNWYLKDGMVKAALTWGRSGDLEAARRLIVDGTELDDRQRAALADPNSNLEADIR